MERDHWKTKTVKERERHNNKQTKKGRQLKKMTLGRERKGEREHQAYRNIGPQTERPSDKIRKLVTKPFFTQFSY